jgi:hypothetical protein
MTGSRPEPNDEDGPLFREAYRHADASGIIGAALVLFAVARHWAFGRQWAVIIGVILLQCVLMVVFWKNH